MNTKQYFPDGFQLFKNNHCVFIQLLPVGISLEKMMNQKEVLTKHGIQILEQLLRAIFYLQTCKVAHREIQPKNIYVSEDFKSIKLIGYHQCCHLENTTSYIESGTYPYFHRINSTWAPYDLSWDLFSFAVVAY